MTLSDKGVPYFCQWESASMAAAMISGEKTPADDPLWQASGALNRDEYSHWANHICGMACLKMVLADYLGQMVPTMQLARQVLCYGGYVVKEGEINGLIYAPFVSYIRDAYGLIGRIEVNKTARDLCAIIGAGGFFMASVHPTIRWPEQNPPKKGGHLVLVTAADDGHVIFHNPSGHCPRAQEHVRLSYDCFDRFFAGRGIFIERPVQRAG